MRIPANEIGFSLCRTPRGKIVTGPVFSGSPTRVDIAVQCPPGSRFVGLMHTHPKLSDGRGGIAQLSATDVRSALRVNAQVSCVGTEKALRCFGVKRTPQ